MRRFYVTVVLALGIVAVSTQVQADYVSLYVPSTYAVSSSYPGGEVWGLVPGGLFDGAVTEADIGTANNLGNQYASYGDSGDTDPTVAMDFGSSTTFNTLVYAQRPGDYADSIDLWFGDSPFSATYPATIPAGAADETLTVSHTGSTLLQYDFVSEHAGQYVLARLNSSYTAFTGNPGGYELCLGNVIPEPSALTLLTCGMLSLLAYAWRKRK